MSDKKLETASTDKDDKELADLLDSALEDFGKADDSKKEVVKTDETVTEQTDNVNIQSWFDDFAQEAAKHFEQDFGQLLGAQGATAPFPGELSEEKLIQMADAAKQVLSNPQVSDESTDFAASISQAIQGLSKGSEGLQNPFGEEDLMKMFEGGPGQENGMIPFMQGMMQGLLTKEVLGPSLQDFTKKFPAYIEENRSKLETADIERYEKQNKLMEDVLEELNKEQESDSAEVKKTRFTKVLDLMQKLQDLGQPPVELMGEAEGPPPFTFDPQGNPTGGLEGVSSECILM